MRSQSQFDDMGERSAIGRLSEAVGDVIAANPAAVGGFTAFAVAMTFFTANALYFQDQPHPSALFATRPDVRPLDVTPGNGAPVRDRNVTRLVFQPTEIERLDDSQIPVPSLRKPAIAKAAEERPQVASAPSNDRESPIATIQELLEKLGYYDGELDGLQGPVTTAAIDAYKKSSGLRGIVLSNEQLIQSLRNNLDITAAVPADRPQTPRRNLEDAAATVAEILAATRSPEKPGLPPKIPSAEVVKVQAALKAFGNTDMVVDGIRGEQTVAAIREFQTLFRIPVTGEIDGPLLDKMRDVGLIQ